MSHLHSCRVPPTVVVLRSSRRRHKPHCHKSKLNRIKLHTISNTSVFRQKVWGLFIRRCGIEPLFLSFNRILSKSMQHYRFWITGKALSWQFSVINPQLSRISLLYARAESIIMPRQWLSMSPWMLTRKLAFDHCIVKHHSVPCSW